MKTRLKIVSDQHIEHMSKSDWRGYLDAIHPIDPYPQDIADVCIIAGDFSPAGGEMLKKFRELCSREACVFYVPGNHDFYSRTPPDGIDEALRLIEEDIANFHILRTGKTIYKWGRRFIGDTMWVPPTHRQWNTRHLINDNELIPMFWDFMPKKWVEFQKYLTAELKEDDIVVTHHLPSTKSVPKFYRKRGNDTLNPWFVSDQEEMITAYKPALWIHGHTHDRCDYYIGKTRIFCNPLGYMSQGASVGRLIPTVIEI